MHCPQCANHGKVNVSYIATPALLLFRFVESVSIVEPIDRWHEVGYHLALERPLSTHRSGSG